MRNMKNKLKAFFGAFWEFLLLPMFFITSTLITLMYVKIFCSVEGYSSIVFGITSDKGGMIALFSAILMTFTIYGLFKIGIYIRDCWKDYKDQLKEINDE